MKPSSFVPPRHDKRNARWVLLAPISPWGEARLFAFYMITMTRFLGEHGREQTILKLCLCKASSQKHPAVEGKKPCHTPLQVSRCIMGREVRRTSRVGPRALFLFFPSGRPCFGLRVLQAGLNCRKKQIRRKIKNVVDDPIPEDAIRH